MKQEAEQSRVIYERLEGGEGLTDEERDILSGIIGTHRYHHRATAPGYQSRLVYPRIEAYSGRFGRGYKLHYPRVDTSRYHYVEYWIEETHEPNSTQ